MAGLRFDAHALHPAQRVVHPLEVVADRLHGNGIVARFGLGEISVPQSENDRSRAHFFVRRPRRAGLASRPPNFAALIEEVLNPGPRRMIGDEVEFIPESIQRLLLLVVEDHFDQRGIVAPVPHHVMVARAQKTSFVLGIVGEKAAALADIECVGENESQAREGILVASPLAVRNHQIGVAGSGFLHQRRRPERRLPSKPGILRDLRNDRRRIALHAQRGVVKIPAVLPVEQGLRVGAQSIHHLRREFHRRVFPDSDHEIAHHDTIRARQVRLLSHRRGQSAPHGAKFGDGANFVLRCLDDLPDHGQVLRTQLRVRRDGSQRRAGLSENRPVLEAPRRQKVVGIVGRLAFIEVHDPFDRILLAVGLDEHRMRREGESAGREHHVIADFARRLQVLVEQGGRHRQRLAGVVEAGGIGGIDGKLPRRPNVDAGGAPALARDPLHSFAPRSCARRGPSRSLSGGHPLAAVAPASGASPGRSVSPSPGSSEDSPGQPPPMRSKAGDRTGRLAYCRHGIRCNSARGRGGRFA